MNLNSLLVLTWIVILQMILGVKSDKNDELAMYHKNLSQFLYSHFNSSLKRNKNESLIVTMQIHPLHLDIEMDERKFIHCAVSFHLEWTDARLKQWQASEHPGGQTYIDVFDKSKYGLKQPFRIFTKESVSVNPLRLKSDGKLEMIHHGNLKFMCRRLNARGYPKDKYNCYARIMMYNGVSDIKCRNHSHTEECALIDTAGILTERLMGFRYAHNWDVKKASWYISRPNKDSVAQMYVFIDLGRTVHYEYYLERSCAIVMGILCSSQYLLAGKSSTRVFFNALSLMVLLFWFHDLQNFRTVVFSIDTPPIVNFYFGVLMLQVIALTWSCVAYYVTIMTDAEIPKVLESSISSITSRIFGATVEQEHLERAQILAINEQILLSGHAAANSANDDLLVPQLTTKSQQNLVSTPRSASAISLEDVQMAAKMKRLLRWNFIFVNLDRVLCIISFMVLVILATAFA